MLDIPVYDAAENKTEHKSSNAWLSILINQEFLIFVSYGEENMSTSTKIQYQSQGQLTTNVRYLHPVKIDLPFAESTVYQPILAFLF